jgi:SAM-dependent methyltransferase
MATKAKKVKEVKELVLEFSKADLQVVKFNLDYEDDSIDQVNIIRVMEYLNGVERINFVNELYRILKKDGKASIITPYWASNKAYGDLDVQWPPVSESWYPHLKAEWRKANNPDETRYKCDFDPTWGYGMHPLIQSRNQEYQQHALTFWKEASQDMIANLTKR